MGVKRWAVIFVLGLAVCSAGFMLLFSAKFAIAAELSLQDLLAWLGWRASSETVDIALALIGLILAGWSAFKMLAAVYKPTAYQPPGRALVDQVYERRQLSHGLKLAAIGGGTGLSTLLRGLKQHTSNISAIVSVADDGGSSGRLSKELGILPPGDLRHCMTALADDENLLSDLFCYRFQDGQGLQGHSFGNLFLAALTDMYDGNFEEALRQGSQILSIRGRVIPATTTPATLCAKLRDGRVIRGESEIPEARGEIVDVFLDPDGNIPPKEVFKVIAEADGIILGPGSLYTSVIPPLLIKGLADAVKKSKAPKIYICNVMTQPGETDKYSAADHLQAINHHVGGRIADYIIVNSAPPQKKRPAAANGSEPIKCDLSRLRSMGVTPVPANLVSEESPWRHNSDFLAETVVDIIAAHNSNGKIHTYSSMTELKAVN